jgi:deazaflavin-dependent oxidoreductase (nitroreductase family)
MSSYHQSALDPVPPSRFVRTVIRPLTKVLNPVMALVAGRRNFGGAATLTHTGRRSGKTYSTPVGAHISGGSAVIPLTFGNTSDWVRNVLAAGGCLIRLNGTEYPLTKPVFRTVAEASPLIHAAFNPMFRVAFKMLGIRQVMVLRIAAGQDHQDRL